MLEDLDVDDSADTPNPLKDARDAASRAEKRAQELEPLARENAFLKAGVPNFNGDDAKPVAKLLYDTYDGELTAEAVKEKAIELGLIEAPSDTTATPDEQTQTRERLDISSGLPVEGLDTSSTFKDAMEERATLLREGKDQPAASVPVFGHILTQAANGDPRYAWDEAAHRESVRNSGDLEGLI